MHEIDTELPELFACSGQSGLTAEGERAYIVVCQGLSKIQKELGVAVALECALASIRAGADWAQLNIGPVSAHDLVQQVASEKWRSMKAARERRKAANG
jgi:hypothetical protein